MAKGFYLNQYEIQQPKYLNEEFLFNRPETSFYKFPGVTAYPEQYDLWLKAIDRVKEDGSPWVPQPKRSLVCSDHFVSGKPR